MDNRIDWNKIAGCSVESRKNLIAYIEQLIELKYASEKNGICSLEDYMKSSEDLYERVALKFIVQGCMPDVCRELLYNLISASEIDSSTYLKYVIFAEFVLMLQKEEVSVQEIRMILLSYLGVECADEFLK